jgi:hypothetical protein
MHFKCKRRLCWPTSSLIFHLNSQDFWEQDNELNEGCGNILEPLAKQPHSNVSIIYVSVSMVSSLTTSMKLSPTEEGTVATLTSHDSCAATTPTP